MNKMDQDEQVTLLLSAPVLIFLNPACTCSKPCSPSWLAGRQPGRSLGLSVVSWRTAAANVQNGARLQSRSSGRAHSAMV